MACTKFLKNVKNKHVEILFFFTIFFTSCMFMDTTSLIKGHGKPYFFAFDTAYLWLKVILAFVLPAVITALTYFKTKSCVRIADMTAVCMTLFTIFFLIDYFGQQRMWVIEKSFIFYHLSYGLITYFTVFVTISVIGYFKKQGMKGYSAFCQAFFWGFASVLIISMITVYFLNRNYGVDENNINLIPFQGEFRAIEREGFSKIILRDIGNFCMYIALAMMLLEITKKHSIALAIIIPAIISTSMEAFQYITVCGDTDIDDVIANVGGAIIGVLIYKFIIVKIKEKELC